MDTLAYYNMELITSLKSFIVEAPGPQLTRVVKQVSNLIGKEFLFFQKKKKKKTRDRSFTNFYRFTEFYCCKIGLFTAVKSIFTVCTALDRKISILLW